MSDEHKGAVDLAEWAYAHGLAVESLTSNDLLDDGSLVRSVIPQGYAIRDTDLVGFLATPRRKTGAFEFTQIASFCAYVVTHKENGTQVFIDRKAATFTAQINGHAIEGPGWADHTATFKLQPTEAWAAWLKQNGRNMTQQEFAEFLEDRIGEISEPSGAELMEAATNLKVNINANFDSKVALANGRISMSYVETLDNGGVGGAGHIRLPEQMSIIVQPYDGSSIATVTARLRWRFDRNAGKVSFWYTLGAQPQIIRDEKIDEAYLEMTKALPDVPLLFGSAVEA